MRRMIVFDLLCGAGHRFEGWFGSAIDFSAQKERFQLSCPSCGSSQVERVPSASRVNLGASEPKLPAQAPVRTPQMEGKDPFAIAQMLYSRMLDELLKKSEDVGAEFPSEARRIFYQEAPARAIRGQASSEEHEQLLEEGIPVARLPVPPSDKLN
jgi:hypothetical protein